MMSYMVMECHPGYVILLDEEGRFFRAANLRYETGQTIYDPVFMKEKPEKQRRTVRWLSSGMAGIAACFLLLFGLSYYQSYMKPYSYVYLTINPQVQMDLNRQGTVVKLTGTNEDGRKLLEGYSGRGKEKTEVADELIDRAIEMGFLAEGGMVSFSIDSPDEVLFQEYGMELRTEVTEHLEGRISVTIEITNYKDMQQEEGAESSSPSAPSQPAPAPSTEPSQAATAPSAEPSQPSAVPSTEPSQPSTAPSAEPSQPATAPSAEPSQPAAVPSAEPSQPAVTPPASSGSGSEADTDYGPNNDGVTDYTPPAASTPAPADTDYGAGSDGVTDYQNGNTNYDTGSDDGDNDDSGDDDSDDDNDDDS